MPSPEGSSVTFRRVPASLGRAPIARFARTLQKEVAKGRPFDILIAGDTELRRLNRDFRGKDYPTDVLSFGIDEDGHSAGPRELGDIVICPSHTADLREAVVHGALHLSGMDHERDDGEMLAVQAELMRWVS